MTKNQQELINQTQTLKTCKSMIVMCLKIISWYLKIRNPVILGMPTIFSTFWVAIFKWLKPDYGR